MFDFEDKVVVITGGASGIGKCIAEEFRKNGAKVTIIDRAPEGNHFVCDISKKEVLDDYVEYVLHYYGHIDYLINNALPLMKGINDRSYEEFQYALSVGVTAPFYLSKLFILRLWRSSDLDDFYAYASVDGVGQMAGWKPHESKEDTRIILDMFIENKKCFALEYQGKAVGSVGIEKYNEMQSPEFDDKKCRELGFALSKELWGHKYVRK